MALLKFVALWVAVSLLLALALGRALREMGGRALADEVEAYLRRMARPRTSARRSGAVTSIITVGVLTLAAGAAAGRHLPPPSFVFGDAASHGSPTRTTEAPIGATSGATPAKTSGASTPTTTTGDDAAALDVAEPTTTVPGDEHPKAKTKARDEDGSPVVEDADPGASTEEATDVTTTTSTSTTSTTLGTPSGTTTSTTEPPPPPEDPAAGN